jgi:hypothetical protein
MVRTSVIAVIDGCHGPVVSHICVVEQSLRDRSPHAAPGQHYGVVTCLVQLL